MNSNLSMLYLWHRSINADKAFAIDIQHHEFKIYCPGFLKAGRRRTQKIFWDGFGYKNIRFFSAGNNFLDHKFIAAEHLRFFTVAAGADPLVFKDIEDFFTRPAPCIGGEDVYYQSGILKQSVLDRHGITLLNITGNHRCQGPDLKDQNLDSGYTIIPCELFNMFHNLDNNT